MRLHGIIVSLLACLTCFVRAFTVSQTGSHQRHTSTLSYHNHRCTLRHHRSITARTMMPMFDHDFLVATIDSDIAKMSDNEFAPVFLGGVLVMFGGLLSALFVGMVVDRKDLSAQLVADSYAQGADDEEFWKGLSEEEKKKAQEILKRVKEAVNPGEGSLAEDTTIAPTTTASTTLEESVAEKLSQPSSSMATTSTATKRSDKSTQNLGMFDDYSPE